MSIFIIIKIIIFLLLKVNLFSENNEVVVIFCVQDLNGVPLTQVQGILQASKYIDSFFPVKIVQNVKPNIHVQI